MLRRIASPGTKLAGSLRTASILVLALAGLAACGDNLHPTDDGDSGTTDASTTAIDAATDATTDAPTDAAVPMGPMVIATVPVSAGIAVPINTTVSATFSRAMNAATITTTSFTLRHGATADVGAVTYAAATNTATLTPTVPLQANLDYTATLTMAVQDTTAMALAASYSWTFHTGATALAPTVTMTTPGPTGAALTTTPTATFSSAMDPTTITTTSFTLAQGAMAIAGVVTLDGATNTARFAPNGPLMLDRAYTATITTAARNTGGLALAVNHVWTFQTSACGLLPVNLAAASGFRVLAGSTVTSTGATSVTGDIGVSPGTAITGFPPGILVGARHAGDPAAAQGIAALTTAYNDVAGRSLCAVTVAGNLGGRTLAPGLYKSTSSLAISAGDLTLDAGGDSGALFIFQMASTLDSTPGRQVILAGGARAANVYWQVGTSATIGTTSAFKGTIMADQSITLRTGARLDGRALARIGAVTLDANIMVLSP